VKLEVENCPTVDDANLAQLKKALKKLKSYGPSSYACLTDTNGNYLQVAGGRVTCFVERYDAQHKKLFRCYHSNSSTNFEDGTVLSFGGGSVQLKKDEWFNIDDVIEIFSSFSQRLNFPDSIHWRELNISGHTSD